VDEKAFHQRRASRLLTFTISDLRFPVETQKPLEKSSGFGVSSFWNLELTISRASLLGDWLPDLEFFRMRFFIYVILGARPEQARK
jgi:hypothetical protein